MRPTRWMRAFLVAAGAFALFAGSLLALGADQTDVRFAWTIASDLTVGFLNGMYWSSALLLLLSAREQFWSSARFGAYSAVLFMTLLLVVMLVHFDVLHTDDSRFLVSSGAWGFLASYAILPAAGLVATLDQLRQAGSDPPRTEPLPAWLRSLLAVQSVAMLLAGAGLLLVATRAEALWPWPLTPIGARAIGAWVLSLGAVSLLAARDADWRRIRVVPPTYGLIAVLQVVVLLRFGGDVEWETAAAWCYLAALGSLLAVGLAPLARRLGSPRTVGAV